MRGKAGWVVSVAAVLVCGAGIAAPAYATVPGTNGKIAFTSARDGNKEVYVVNPDGSGETNLSANGADDFEPAWSPDGQKIAFISNRELSPHDQYPDLWIMDTDGGSPARLSLEHSGVTWLEWYPDGSRILFFASRCTDSTICGAYSVSPAGGDVTDFGTCCFGQQVTWSPYGEPLAYTESTSVNPPKIHTVNPDGSGDQVLSSAASATLSALDWSPDARSLVFDGYPSGLRTVDWPSGEVRDVPGTSSTDIQPTWSPDGTRLAFVDDLSDRIATIGADGTGRTVVTAGEGAEPDWQPLGNGPFPQGYARPKAATPVGVSLVPAYLACAPAGANRTHGPPLAYPSCHPAALLSQYLTVGTADSNGQPTLFLGSIKFKTLPGDPATSADDADVEIQTSMTDIRCRVGVVEDPETEGYPCRSGALTDYTGEVQLLVRARITDKPPTGPRTGTVQDIELRASVPCVATPTSAAGSTCALSTTMDSLIPGSVSEGRRAIWTLGRIEVLDAGVDGDADTLANNGLFAVQGVFVP